jgi:hypothetical protein
MTYDDFINSLNSSSYLSNLDTYGDWNKAHLIVQTVNDTVSARIHVYLHRVELMTVIANIGIGWLGVHSQDI